MYQKVLVPLDLSELAECSLNYVKKWAKEGTAGEVILLNVIEIDPSWDTIVKGFDIDAFRLIIRNKAESYLASVQSRLAETGIKVKTEIVEDNNPARAIADYARQNGVDVIVIASHGYTGIRRLMFGSVALNVLTLAQVPVLLIRPESCQI